MTKWSPQWKHQQLERLRAEWGGCQKCPTLVECRRNIVFGHGAADADVMFIGEAPGEHEDKTGYPFVGRSGELLDALLRTINIDREQVYITNMTMCRPPENRDPLKTEKDNCYDRLRWEIYLVDPMIIVPVGKQAMEGMMGRRSVSMEAGRGKAGTVVIPGIQMEVTFDAIPIYHPSFLLRMETPKEPGVLTNTTIEDLQMIFDSVAFIKDQYANYRRNTV